MVKKKNKKIKMMYLELEAFRHEQSVEEAEKRKWVCGGREVYCSEKRGKYEVESFNTISPENNFFSNTEF